MPFAPFVVRSCLSPTTESHMNHRQRFLRACRCEPVDRPPLWVMRQAGRHLPEYLKLKEEYSFHQLAQNPELACEVTLQPLRRYDMDAAIVFTDILVIPEAMGQNYGFPKGGGIEMEFAVESSDDVDRLTTDGIAEKLKYVGETLELLRDELGDERALIGFGGSPWTLATYMIEGGSSKHKENARALFYTDRPLFDRLMQMITDSLIEYLQMQIDAGVDAIQIFDSWGGVLAPEAFREGSAKWMKKLVDAIDGQVPTIVFSRGMHEHIGPLVETGADVLGVDWTVRLADIKATLPENIAVQGNLDPVLMNTTPELVRREATKILEEMRGFDGHIFNLGHGISPKARIECMQALVEAVSTFE